MAGKRVLSVGQCMPDQGAIARLIQQKLGAEVVAAHSSEEALQRLRSEAFDLVLVNRVFDADATPGIELVQQLKADGQLQKVPVMLVSNYEDAQQEAVQAGALPGFGKSSLHRADTVIKLKTVL